MKPDRTAIPIEAAIESPTSNSSHTLPAQDEESGVKKEHASGQDSASDGEHSYDYPKGLQLASILAGATMSYYLLFLDLAIISTSTPRHHH